jgi:osmotically-inducible protein OsmY
VKTIVLILLAIAFGVGLGLNITGPALAQNLAPAINAASNSNPPSKSNVSNATPTPGDLTQDAQDTKLTQKIKDTLTADGQLSSTVPNLTISTSDGVVTVRGQVGSEEQGEYLITKIAGIVGETNVRNQLEIAGQ